MKIMLDEGAKVSRAHPYDAGLDLHTPKDILVPETRYSEFFEEVEIGTAIVDTGIHVEIPEGYVGFIKSKSGLNVKHGLVAEGVIDAHYTGSIVVKLYNYNTTQYCFEAGDKIAQLVILPCLLPDLELADSLEETDRGDAGFGSTGR